MYACMYLCPSGTVYYETEMVVTPVSLQCVYNARATSVAKLQWRNVGLLDLLD